MATQELLPLKIRRKDLRRRGEATNLYLKKNTKLKGAQIARERYGYSLSTLVNELLEREISLKGGLLTARLIGARN